MSWGLFFTYLAQGLIISFCAFMVYALFAGFHGRDR